MSVEETANEASTSTGRPLAEAVVAWASIVLGSASIVLWLAFLGVLFVAPGAGMGTSQVLLSVVGTGALFGFVANRRLGIAAAIAAAVHIGVWVYFRVDFDTTMPDALFFVLVALLYATPPVAGGIVLAAGLKARAALAAKVVERPLVAPSAQGDPVGTDA